VHSENTKPKARQLVGRCAALVGATLLAAFFAWNSGLGYHQTMSVSIFLMIILSTLFFWTFRLAIAFIGIAALLGSRALDLQSFVLSSELPIILFLVGMMVTVGVLKELGLFTWIIQLVIGMEKMDGLRFTMMIVVLSALMACAVDEVTSIVFVSTLIFQVCDTTKVRPAPFVIIAVLATNIGSSGTMLGNPVGILIGHKAGLTFSDFIVWAFPVMSLALLLTLILLTFWFRKDIALLTERLQARREVGLGLGPLVKIPYVRGLMILVCMLGLVASHHRVETWLGVQKNTILIVAPLFIAGILMIWRRERARHYVETEVEWWTLLFFMMLFAVAGALEHTAVTTWAAGRFTSLFGQNPVILTPVILLTSAIGSAFVDNVVFVAAFIPVVKELHSTPLWWALLFGACFGGNITMIGSTANIVALGMLEKRYRSQIRFGEWFRIGAIVGLISCAVAWGSIAALSGSMPALEEKPAVATTMVHAGE